MRKFFITCLAAAALLVIGAFASPGAEAMTVPAPAGLNAAIHEANPAQHVAYICQRAWRCGYYGCGWRRTCYWGPRYDYGYGYGYYRPYRYGWRHRHREWW